MEDIQALRARLEDLRRWRRLTRPKKSRKKSASKKQKPVKKQENVIQIELD